MTVVISMLLICSIAFAWFFFCSSAVRESRWWLLGHRQPAGGAPRRRRPLRFSLAYMFTLTSIAAVMVLVFRDPFPAAVPVALVLPIVLHLVLAEVIPLICGRQNNLHRFRHRAETTIQGPPSETISEVPAAKRGRRRRKYYLIRHPNRAKPLAPGVDHRVRVDERYLTPQGIGISRGLVGRL